MNDSLAFILRHQIVAILRGYTVSEVVSIAEAMADGGIRSLEVTLNSPNATESISQLSKRLGHRMLIGAGTVLEEVELQDALDAGAKFIVSPHTSPALIERTRRQGAVSIPGAFTPTEVVQAHRAGGQLIKIFPSSLGVSYIKELRAPLNNIPLMPTGGINAGNIQDFKNAGAFAFGIGSALLPGKGKVDDSFLSKVRQLSEELVNALSVG